MYWIHTTTIILGQIIGKKLTFDPDMIWTLLKRLECRELKMIQNGTFNFVKIMIFDWDMTETSFFATWTIIVSDISPLVDVCRWRFLSRNVMVFDYLSNGARTVLFGRIEREIQLPPSWRNIIGKKLTFDPDMIWTLLKWLECRECKMIQNGVFNFVKIMIFDWDMTETRKQYDKIWCVFNTYQTHKVGHHSNTYQTHKVGQYSNTYQTHKVGHYDKIWCVFNTYQDNNFGTVCIEYIPRQ
jgi:hypothetical protein